MVSNPNGQVKGLFGKSKEAVAVPGRAVPSRVETLIGSECNFEGRLESQGAIRIEGRFEGEIKTESDVIVGEKGRTQANIEAANLFLAGQLQGNVVVSGRLEIASTGRLEGDVWAQVISIEPGGFFQGYCHMSQGSAGATKALPSSQSTSEARLIGLNPAESADND